jgi:predicted ATPase/DNA-binding SARP family transcriptional activator
MQPLRIYLFGAPRIEQNNKIVNISRRKVVALLAYLTVTNQPQSRDTLAALLWPDLDQSDARANLRRDLSRLRTVLGNDALAISRRQVALADKFDFWLDAAVFREALAVVRAHAHSPDQLCPDCLAQLTDAAALYGADFLAGFSVPDCPAFDEWLFFEAEGLRAALAEMLQILIAWHTTQAAYPQSIEYGRRWLALDTLHEPAHRALMQLYAWDGQQAAALRQYQECERILEEELGVEPEEETTALYEQIKSRHLPIPERSPEVVSPDDPAVPPPKTAAPHNLTPPPTPFVGRKAELAQMQKMLTAPDCRLVTVVGLGGMGKSRLALEAARQVGEMAERPFPHGTFFIPLTGVAAANAVPTTIADALNLTLTGSDSPEGQIVNALAQKTMLLLLDNFEHLLEDSAQSDVAINLVTAILTRCPGVKLLVTSREPLQLEAEWRLPLEGLAYASGEEGVIDHFEATQLFVQTAVQVQPDFALMPGVTPIMRRICQITAGTPLALKLAAAWLRAIPLTQIASEMEKSLDILATNMRDVPSRQRSMRAVFDYTWSMLTVPEQATFRGLAVFRGGFSAEAARGVAQASPFLLAGLVDRSLVQKHSAGYQKSAGASARYEIHELARQYAAQQATEAEHITLADAHAHFFADFVWQRCETILQGEYQTAIDELSIEQNNIVAAWQWLLTRLDHSARPVAELLGQMACTLKHFYYAKGPLHNARQLYLEAVEKMQAMGWETDAGDAEAVAKRLTFTRMQVRAAFFSFTVSDYETATQLLLPAVAWLRRQQEVEELGLALSVLGKCYLLRGERKLAEEQVQESVALLEQADELYEYADALKALGSVEVDDGRYETGMTYFEQSLALYRKQEFLPGIQQLLHNIGTTCFRQGNYESAAQYYREALAIAERAGIRRGIMQTSDALGGVQRILGNFKDSVPYHEKGITLARELGEQRWLAASLVNLGQAYVWMGETRKAVGSLQEGLSLAWETENVPDALASLTYLAEAWARQGRVLPAFGLAYFLVEQPQIRANIKETAANLLEELQSELPQAAAQAAQKWAADHSLSEVTAVALSGPPVIPLPADPRAV